MSTSYMSFLVDFFKIGTSKIEEKTDKFSLNCSNLLLGLLFIWTQCVCCY